jgi:hypothetical protein
MSAHSQQINTPTIKKGSHQFFIWATQSVTGSGHHLAPGSHFPYTDLSATDLYAGNPPSPTDHSHGPSSI